jgi:F-type H+-transporting ATPase subunit delta
VLKESIAQRYSEALFSLAKERGAVESVAAELDAFVAALDRDPELAIFFDSPVVDRTLKQQLLKSTLESRVGELTLNFIVLLVRKRRENLIHIIARQMHELLDRAAGRQSAAIGTPMAIQHNELADLARRLSSVYETTIIPQAKVSPDLLGGLVVQVGDSYVDASVAGKLEELRRHLLDSPDTWATTSPNGKSEGSQP